MITNKDEQGNGNAKPEADLAAYSIQPDDLHHDIAVGESAAAISKPEIQRYIREGRLRASKIGKNWRITGHDLSVFTESEKGTISSDGTNRKTPVEDKIRVSFVIDISVCDMDDAIRITNKLTAVLNSKPPEYDCSSMYTQYLEYENKARITLWGGIRFMEAIIGSISMLVELPEQE